MRNPTPWILALIVSGGLFLLAAKPASAHGPARVYDHYYVGHYPAAWPHWLRAHGDFRRWYGYRAHRYDRRVGWQRLYRHYRHDRHYHRKLKHHRKHRNRHYRRRHH